MNSVFTRRILRSFAIAVVAATSSAVAQQDGSPQHDLNNYEYHFGQNPFSPSNALTDFKGFLDPKNIPTAKYCGHCHSTLLHEWSESAHGNSFREPFYTKNVQLLIDEKGIAYTRHCEGCHNPIALFSGSLTTGSKVERPFDQEGISCIVCHSVKALQDTTGTGSYVMGTPAVMLAEDGSPVTGEVSDEAILARPDLHRRAVMRDIYRTPEFCAACHKAALPRQLNGYKWLRAFSVYDEWQQSAWAMQSPLPFYRKSGSVICQNCHMPKVPSGTDAGGHSGQVASHRWLAANTAIPTFFHYDEQLEKTKEFLKGAVSADIFGFRKSDAAKTPVSVLKSGVPFDLRAGETVTFDVVVQNGRIGHSFVPEQRDFYEAWCEFEVSDATGRTLLHSGYLKPDGQLEEHAHSYETHLLSAAGELLDHHQVWDARIRAYDNTIMPGRGELVRYRVTLPADAQGPITAVARVNYRRFRKDFTDWVLGQKTSYPIVVVAEDKVELELGKNSASSADASRESRSWNNYGIALLDQQEYDRAAQAFEHAVESSPDNVDSYINVAIAAASDGRYEDAHKWLTKALGRQPKDERALAYRGLVYRLQYRLDDAIAYLKPSVQSYPRLRITRQELGYAYFLKGDFQNARTQYEALQQIDPDALEAHRYLSSVYSKLGLKDLAAREAAAYAEELDNPAVAYLTRSYWTTHPAVASESVRSHVHGQESIDPLQKSLDELLKTSLIWPSN